jgi:hypothetical protein
MSFDGVDEFLGIVPLPEPSEALGGMEVGILFEIQVVEQTGYVPEVGIAVEEVRVSFHRGSDHQGVVALVVVVDVFFEERVRFWFGREVHGTGEKIHRLEL